MWPALKWYDRKEVVAVRRSAVVTDLGVFFGARRFCIHYAYYMR